MGSSGRGVCIKEVLISFLMAGITACFYASGNDSVGKGNTGETGEGRDNCKNKALTEQQEMGPSSHLEELALERRTHSLSISSGGEAEL